MTKKKNWPKPKFTLTNFFIELVFFEDLQRQPRVNLILIFIVGVYQNIINEHNPEWVKVILEKFHLLGP